MNKLHVLLFPLYSHTSQKRHGSIMVFYTNMHASQIMSLDDASASIAAWGIQYAAIMSKWINRILISILLID